VASLDHFWLDEPFNGLDPTASTGCVTWRRTPRPRSGLVSWGHRREHGVVPFDVQRLLRMWTDPLPEDDGAAAAAFRELYSDPVTVNGNSLTVADMVTRARVMQRALEAPEREVLSVVDAGASVAVAFRLAGRQVGPLDTPAGRVPPTGQRVDLRVIDILTLTDGRISSIWMVADWLTALTAAGALRMPVAPVMP
jgi:predicted ester cyclase